MSGCFYESDVTDVRVAGDVVPCGSNELLGEVVAGAKAVQMRVPELCHFVQGDLQEVNASGDSILEVGVVAEALKATAEAGDLFR